MTLWKRTQHKFMYLAYAYSTLASMAKNIMFKENILLTITEKCLNNVMFCHVCRKKLTNLKLNYTVIVFIFVSVNRRKSLLQWHNIFYLMCILYQVLTLLDRLILDSPPTKSASSIYALISV